MPRTFLEPGAAATNWKFAGSMPSRVSDQDPNNGSINAAQVTISWGLPFPYSGWQITIFETTPTSVSIPSSPVYTVHISSPLTGINQTYSGDDYEFYIDGWELTAVECEAWSAAFTELRLYVDGVLVLTVAGASYAGVGYDTRQRKPRVQAISFNVGEDFTPQYICSAEFNRSLSMSCTARLAYWWWDGGAWVAENIEIDASMALPATTPPAGCGACTCAGTLPSISGTTTAQVDVTAEWYYVAVSTRGADRVCECASTGDTFTRQFWTTVAEFKQKSSWVDVVAEHETLLHETLRTRVAGCSCQFPLLDGESTVVETPTTEALTYCQSFQQTIRWAVTTQCTIGGFICPELPWPAPPQNISCGAFADLPLCYYSGYVMLTWPDSLCGGSCCSTIDIAPNGRMYTAYLLTATSAVVAGFASTGFMSDNSAIAWKVYDAGFTADALNIRYDRCGSAPLLWLVYEDAGDIKRRYSANHGETWSVATTIATGANPTHDPIESGLRYVYYRSGTTLRGIIYDTEWNTVVADFLCSGVTLDSDSTVETKVHGGGAGQVVIVVTYKDGGNVKYAYSRDGQAFI